MDVTDMFMGDARKRTALPQAKWIWFPSERTLPNTFVLFRKEVDLCGGPVSARGWITADSRYRLTVNGHRVQWGPAPCDPRSLEVDPVDLGPYLVPGTNVLGVEVLFYGVGDGTWAAGKPGLLCSVEIVDDAGGCQSIATDESWRCMVDRAHRPGQYKRWFLRALQEEFDARLHPQCWDTPGYVPDSEWIPALVLPCAPDKPPISGAYPDYLGLDRVDENSCSLVKRDIPLVREEEVASWRLTDVGRVRWLRSPDDWFEFRVPGSFMVEPDSAVAKAVEGGWELTDASGGAVYATFEFREQVVGWPHISIEAPAGTVIELICQESHDPSTTHWLDSHLFTWSRFVCMGGANTFETFDFESLRWLQLHVRDARAPVVVRRVGVWRRKFDWPCTPELYCSEEPLQRLLSANVNTLVNSAVETVADGGGRERQQYSGDGGHQLSVIRYAFGETRLPRRFLRTFSQGITPDGYFLDCWPAYDRLARVGQRQFGATQWGPLLDHGVGFVFDCWQHLLETADRAALDEPYPRIIRFGRYLASLAGRDGLLPVEGLGVPSVWIDHHAYRLQRHKLCAFNLYVAAMYEHAMAPLCRVFGDVALAAEFEQVSARILAAVVAQFWDPDAGLFIANRPWIAEEQGVRLCDRSLATAILFDQCPDHDVCATGTALADCPPEMGLSYPCNAVWRYHALAHVRRIDTVLRDLRQRWATMPSVLQNNSIQEEWVAWPDSPADWSHCAMAPLRVMFMDVAGIRPTAPGFSSWVAEPQLGDLPDLRIVAHTVRGPIQFQAWAERDGHRVEITARVDIDGELILPAGSDSDLEYLGAGSGEGLERFALPVGAPRRFWVPGDASRRAPGDI